MSRIKCAGSNFSDFVCFWIGSYSNIIIIVELLCYKIPRGPHFPIEKCMHNIKKKPAYSTRGTIIYFVLYDANIKLTKILGSFCNIKIQTYHGIDFLSTLNICVEFWIHCTYSRFVKKHVLWTESKSDVRMAWLCTIVIKLLVISCIQNNTLYIKYMNLWLILSGSFYDISFYGFELVEKCILCNSKFKWYKINFIMCLPFKCNKMFFVIKWSGNRYKEHNENLLTM